MPLLSIRVLAAVLALALASAAVAQSEEDAEPRAALDRFTSPTLTRFSSEAEFEAYVETLGRLSRSGWGRLGENPVRFAQATLPTMVQQDAAPEPVCAPDDPQCPGDPEYDGEVVVTGTVVRAANASITNNQMRGVDEGDIVKQIGRFLIVLSDGRLFVIDTNGDGRGGLALADRIDVYRDPRVDTWYDEMLVLEDRILVTGYTYDEEATELSVFRLAPDGRLRRDGVFMISSNDYYDTSNYATRIVGDSLVLYTPLDVIDAADGDRLAYPTVRRWVREEEHEEAERRGRPLYDATQIYRPVRIERNPTIHSVSVCPLGEVGEARELECRTTAVIGPASAQWYVTAGEVIVWTGSRRSYDTEECRAGFVPTPGRSTAALLFRFPHGAAAAPQVAAARGLPFDQFSMQINGGRLRALVDRRAERCYRDWAEPVQPMHVDLPLRHFGARVEEVPLRVYTPVPSPGTQWIANRFTESHLVYGGLSRFRRGPPEIDWDDYDDRESRDRMRRQLAIPPAYVVAAASPSEPIELDIGHTVIRAERYGDSDIVLTGYRGRKGLSISMIDLDGTPGIDSTIELEGRFESEGRSHAFNSISERNGSGLIGLPTSPQEEDSDRYWWRSRASDVSFIEVGRNGDLGDLGRLDSSVYHDRRGADEDGLEGYECEVSCIDWYGNSRPIFTDGRIFALTGVELVEGRIVGGGIREVRRFDFARARPRR